MRRLLALLCLGLSLARAHGEPVAPACHTQILRAAAGSFRDCEGAPEMIALRGGSFRMGDLVGDGQPYERPAHPVKIAAFALGRFELTSAEWRACVAAGGCTAAHVISDEQHGRYPVEGVSWLQAQAYADWLAARTGKPYRLPSEAEWEYAARAGGEDRYSWGSSELDACSHVNLLDRSGKREHPQWYWAENCDDRFPGAAPVGSFPANDWGFHDMLGNVWEWVADCWHADYGGAPADGSAWAGESCRKRVNRGGGWGNNLHAMRLSARDADPAESWSDGLGLRVARSLSAAELAQAGTPPDSRPRLVEREPPIRVAREHAPAPPVSPPAPAVPPPVTSLAHERELSVHLTVKGEQSWVNGVQHTQGGTAQDYSFSTRLRTDGVLYADNLLDPDPARRQDAKQRWFARRGLLRLKAANGGKLPLTAEELAALSARLQSEVTGCAQDVQCGDAMAERLSALEALKNNTVSDLEEALATPASPQDARWLYFSGYAGCPVQIRISSETHIAGERAYNHRRTHLVPWSFDRAGSGTGNADDQAQLCRRYLATIDVRTGEVDLENLFIPQQPGTTIRRIHRRVENIQADLPIPPELLHWTNDKLRHTTESGNFSDTLPANAPFDGDYTPLGLFSGRLEVTMSWRFAAEAR